MPPFFHLGRLCRIHQVLDKANKASSMASDKSVDEVVERVVNPPVGETDEALRDFLRDFNSKDLRTACRTLHIRVRSKNANLDNKPGYMSMLVLLARSRRETEQQQQQNERLPDPRTPDSRTPDPRTPDPRTPDPRTPDPRVSEPESQLDQFLTSTRKTIHCSFRLVNVLFSERFYQRLAGMGARPAKWRQLEAEEAARRNQFWQEVADEYSVNRAAYGGLVSSDGRFTEVDPGHIVPHTSEKLMNMWKEMSTDYAAAYERSLETTSISTGDQRSNFYSYCLGKLESLYVSAWLLTRPEAFLAVMNRVPKRAQVVTLDDESTGDEDASVTSAPSKKRRRHANQGSTSVEGSFRDIQERERARLFSELEALTKALCAAKQAGMRIETTKRLEAKIEQYVDQVAKIKP